MAQIRCNTTLDGESLFGLAVTHPPFDAEAADRISVSLVAGGGDKTITVQPAAADKLKLLLITLSRYDSGTAYKVNGAGTAFAVTGPQLFSGGAIAVFGAAVNSLEFSDPGLDVTVEILAVRDAVA